MINLGSVVIRQESENSDIRSTSDNESCAVCRDLLNHMEKFFEMLQNVRKTQSDWLTVDDIATELKISKTVIYRLIRNGEIEAINVVENKGKFAKKGHYRIKRQSLQKFIEAKEVKPLSKEPIRSHSHRNWPKVKNHLGL